MDVFDPLPHFQQKYSPLTIVVSFSMKPVERVFGVLNFHNNYTVELDFRSVKYIVNNIGLILEKYKKYLIISDVI